MSKSLQEVFTTVAVHLLRQNEKSMGQYPSRNEHMNGHPVGGCMYRGDNGLKCAVGVLIPDSVYTLALEGECIAGNNVRAALRLSSIDLGPATMENMLSALQRVHDNDPVYYWAERLSHLAFNFHLQMPDLATLDAIANTPYTEYTEATPTKEHANV